MKISNSHYSKRNLVTLIAIAAIIAAGSMLYVYAFNGNLFGWHKNNSSATVTSKGINYKPPTSDQKKTGDQIKQESLDASNGKTNTQSDTPPAPTPHTGSKSTVGVSITASNQNGNTYQIRSQIDTPTDAGTCTLTLTKGSASVTKTAGVQALAKVSTCKGFDIPTDELSPGVWQMTLHFENDTLTGSTSGTITVQ